jgi:hypothetical protein
VQGLFGRKHTPDEGNGAFAACSKKLVEGAFYLGFGDIGDVRVDFRGFDGTVPEQFLGAPKSVKVA